MTIPKQIHKKAKMTELQNQTVTKRKDTFFCLKWYNERPTLIIFIILSLFASFCLILRFQHFYQSNNTSKTDPDPKKPPHLEIQNIKSVSCIVGQCSFTCQNMNQNSLVEGINSSIDEVKNCNELELILDNVKFNNPLTEGWLNKIEADITSLKIINCLDNLETGAFSSQPFNKLKKLTLGNTNVKLFKKDLFENSTLEELNINYWSFTTVEFEENTLFPVAKTLKLLQLQLCLDSTNLEIVTGSKASAMTALTVLDIRFNRFQKITEDSFKNVENIEIIYLSNSNLLTIEKNSFKYNSYLKYLYLDHNNLDYLPEGIFDTIAKMQQSKIYITQNPWNCNCDFLWFKNFFDNNKMMFDEFSCFVNGKYVNNKDVDFCNENSTTNPKTSTPATITTSSISTLSVTLSTTTIPPEKNKDFTEIDCLESLAPYNGSSENEPKTVLVRNGTITITFTQINNLEMYKVDIAGENFAGTLFWKSSREKICANCIQNVRKSSFMVPDLKYGETYVFCLLPENETAVSPFDCAGLTVPLEWESQTWLPNKSKNLLIGTSVGAGILVIFLTGLIVFYCIRQHPNLIKGNKRVIIVANKSTDALVMPKNYGQLNYVPPSMISYSDGYLIPRVLYYDHVREHSYGCRTNSTFTRSSYQPGVSVKRRRVENDVEEELYESPPPLPPNHPPRFSSCSFKRGGF